MRPKPLLVIVLVLVALAGFVAGSLYHDRVATEASNHGVLTYICPMHPQYTSHQEGDCPMCGMRLVLATTGEASGSGGMPAGLRAGTVTVSGDKRQLMGIRVVEVERRPVVRTMRTSGWVAADETRLYRITAATSGWIERAMPNTVGSLVRKHEVLATFYAREFLGVQQTYFYSLNALDRFKEQNASEAQMNATKVQVESSIDNLRSLGMSTAQIEELARTRQRTYEINLTAPETAFILERNVTEGQRIQEGDDLYLLADLRRVWVLADLFERERAFVKPGTTAPVIYNGETRQAKVTDVLPEFDPESRVLRVRLELDNPGYLLRPGMFVDVDFPVTTPPAIVVPADAVIDSGLRKTVFVDRGEGLLEPRAVKTGWRFDGVVEIVEGLEPGELVVASGTFLVDSESRIRAAAAGFASRPHQDPICGMDVDPDRARAAGRVSTHDGTEYYFCSDDCKRRFDADPAAALAGR